jgi:hypothetical protein
MIERKGKDHGSGIKGNKKQSPGSLIKASICCDGDFSFGEGVALSWSMKSSLSEQKGIAGSACVKKVWGQSQIARLRTNH